MQRFEFDKVVLELPDHLLDANLTKKMQSGQYEESEARAARMRVKKGSRVLELGGGVGYISSVCAQITDPANIVTVEANPNTLDIIRHNLDLNGASKAQLIHGAVVGRDADMDTVLFRVGRVFWGSSIADARSPSEDVVEVPAVSIADLFRTHRPNIVIIDIEGAEQHLFDRPWPQHVRQVIMEIHPKRYPASTIKDIVDCMSKSGLTYDPGCSRGALLAFRRVFKDPES
ncbi:FkbM family methyltransferase [Tateyamaria sp.]|uniref:FkbM family methyltransferase n=1 Tax=Tateyamaria sp. TaxID=1929288 RepID=UPI00329C4C5C